MNVRHPVDLTEEIVRSSYYKKGVPVEIRDVNFQILGQRQERDLNKLFSDVFLLDQESGFFLPTRFSYNII